MSSVTHIKKEKQVGEKKKQKTRIFTLSTFNYVPDIELCFFIWYPDEMCVFLQAAREGYIAIIMPKPTDWPKIKDSLLTNEDYEKLRGLC